MRYSFGLMCVLALGVMSLAGCQETAGSGGSAGSGGTGGTGGIPGCEVEHDCDDGNECTEGAWVDDSCENTAVEDGAACDDGNECTMSACANGVCDSTPVQDGTSCTQHPFAGSEGTCVEGRCTVACDTGEDCIDDNECAVGVCNGGTCDSTPVQNGTLCSLGPFIETEGNCVEGQCTRPCGFTEDCIDDSDCTEDRCLHVGGGSRCGHTDLTDGTTCAGGTCQVGTCQVTSLDIPCTEQGFRNVVWAGCGPYTFHCDGPTEVWGGMLFDKDIILDGGGNVTVEGPLLARGVSAELRGFVIANGPIRNFGGTLRVINSTVTSDGEAERGQFGLLPGATLTLTGCTLPNSGEILNDDGVVLIANSTLSFGSEGGGVRNVSAEGGLTVINSTLRSSGAFPVIAVTGDSPPAMIAATVVDGQCMGDITSLGYNIESPGHTCGFDHSTDQVDVSAEDLKLGPLQDNGGPTETHPLGAGSVAIDVIPEAECLDADGEPLTTDQRGEPRPGGTMCDVGAFEVQP